jgi:hypothetical protein
MPGPATPAASEASGRRPAGGGLGLRHRARPCIKPLPGSGRLAIRRAKVCPTVGPGTPVLRTGSCTPGGQRSESLPATGVSGVPAKRFSNLQKDFRISDSLGRATRRISRFIPSQCTKSCPARPNAADSENVASSGLDPRAKRLTVHEWLLVCSGRSTQYSILTVYILEIDEIIIIEDWAVVLHKGGYCFSPAPVFLPGNLSGKTTADSFSHAYLHDANPTI